MGKTKELSEVAKQVKRSITLNKRRKMIRELPDCPTLLSLNELAEKTGLPYQFLRRMIVVERKLPYIRVGNKYCVNYSVFLDKLNNMEV